MRCERREALVVTDITRNTVLSDQCSVAGTFFARFRGLQMKKDLPKGCGLLITPCNSIHMFFMRFPIDAVFIDRDNTILYIEECIKPWRISKMVNGSKSVLELPAGTASAAAAKPGDLLEFR
ncbi:MAG: DUF192 domain-containing protein [Clostridiaceae bacterium]